MASASTERNVEYLTKRMKFAWAKYYETERNYHKLMTDIFLKLQNVQTESFEIPQNVKTELEELAMLSRKTFECPICLDIIPLGQLDITNCGHKYCKTCLDTLKRDCPTPKCSICRKNLKSSH